MWFGPMSKCMKTGISQFTILSRLLQFDVSHFLDIDDLIWLRQDHDLSLILPSLTHLGV